MKKIKQRVFDVIEIGTRYDWLSTGFDLLIVVAILANLTATLLFTFKEMQPYTGVLNVIELVTILLFTLEYILRIWTAEYLYPDKPEWKAVICFIFSFYGIIDLLTILPFYLPFVFPTGAVAFRMLRVFRIFRLFKINSQSDAFNVVTGVLKEKRNQLFSSVCLIFILMLASSLIMYGLEHDAQPDAFANAFSGIWWSVSTMLTVGYGDIYPVTLAGKVMAIIISFLGVGLVAVPTGIISAGFVEQYTKIKQGNEEGQEKDFVYVVSDIGKDKDWVGRTVGELELPPEIVLVMILRDDDSILPDAGTVLKENDRLVLGTKRYSKKRPVNLREIIIKEESKWIGQPIRDLDISRLDTIVTIQRDGRLIDPDEGTVIRNGDALIVHNRRRT